MKSSWLSLFDRQPRTQRQRQQSLRKLPRHMHRSQNGDGASAVILVKVHDVILVRDQLMRPRHAGTGATRKIGIGQLFDLVINQQPRRNGCTGVVLIPSVE
jgi:hypothetical protein